MPLATVRARLIRSSPNADPVYWSWAVDGAEYNEESGEDLYAATLLGLVNGTTGATANFVSMAADLIELFPAAGGPAYYVSVISPTITVGAGGANHGILQCVVNELVDTPRGPGIGGRMNVGPLAGVTGVDITSSARLACVRVMQEMHEAHSLGTFTPVTLRRQQGGAPLPTPVGRPIIGYRADTRYDILRSRRVETPGTVLDFPPLPPS